MVSFLQVAHLAASLGAITGAREEAAGPGWKQDLYWYSYLAKGL